MRVPLRLVRRPCRGISRHEPADIGGGEAFVTFNPIGIVLAVMPWNFPFWQVFRAAAPALMAGNGMLLKHASNVPGCALAIEEVLHQAGVPKDLFRTLLLPSQRRRSADQGRQCRRRDADRKRSGRAQAVATAAGSVLKKCVLELGGADAYLVLEDADIAAAAKIAATARMVNGGQSCIAGKRFIVVRSILEPFEQALVEAMRGYEMGDPTQGRHQARPDAEREGARRDPQPGRGKRRQGRASCCSAARCPTGPAPGIRRRC